MLLYSMVIWLMLREDVITQSLQILNSDYDSRNRYAALDAMRQFDGIRDKRVMDYYRGLWKVAGLQDPNKPRIFFLDELTKPKYYCKAIKALLVEFLRSKDVSASGMLPYLYRIRSEWWNDREVVDLVQTKLKKFYHLVWDMTKAPTGKDAPLRHWIDMCKYRALMGDKSMAKVYEDNLADTRELQDLRSFAGPEVPYEPQPSRVCDYMLIAALQLGEVDIHSFFALYGYRDIEFREYHDRLIAIYDQMIREFPDIKKNYLSR
jgi:hypothetical protein